MNTNVTKLIELILGEIPSWFERIPTEEELIGFAESKRHFSSSKYPVSDEEFEIVIGVLRENIAVEIGYPHFLHEVDTTHQSWYPEPKSENYYWNRYRQYLIRQKNWSQNVVMQLDKTTSSIMNDLGNPNSSVPFSRRGLLLGEVQSGKTATYTAICNKAADAGYKVIIVLAGITESLRRQTQERLDAEFAGRESKDSLESQTKATIIDRTVGVGEIFPINPDKRISCFTSAVRDFNSVLVDSNDISLRGLKETALFVVKKNSKILKNLHKWLNDNNESDINNKIHLSLLLIDDEADNASINTRKPENDPTAVNLQIRKILNKFYQSSYIGITATPFANIFINPETKDGKLDDLFPRDFITVLPSPSNYIGAEKIFGLGNLDNVKDRSNCEYSKVLVRIMESEMRNYFPFKHKRDVVDTLDRLPEDQRLPKSLKDALYYFILASAVRDFRGDEKEHCSMLINVSRFTDVQNKIFEIVEKWLYDVKYEIEEYGRMSISQTADIPHLQCLKKIWDEYEFETKAKCGWQLILQEYLNDAAKRIEVQAVNQSTGRESLNYNRYRERGMRVIAVGGNSLSRGLTLEGLCVSYFYRNTMMYDALLQMGRWFGYRPNYDDLFKIWMAAEAVDWYGLVTDASHELKNELLEMERQNRTPKEFGLCVRQDPNSLLITARNKMQTGTQVAIPISLSARLIETPRLVNDMKILEANEAACKRLIDNLEKMPHIKKGTQKSPSAVVWYDVPSENIVELLQSFISHDWHLNYRSQALIDYIRKNRNSLHTWDVAVPNGGEVKEYSLHKNCTINPEKRKVQISGDMISVSGTHIKVGSGNSTRIGLTEDQIKAINDECRNNGTKKSDRTYLKTERKPILMIHVLKIEPEEPDGDCPEYLFALGLGFPLNGNKDEAVVKYMFNSRKLKEMLEIEEDEEEEMEDYDD